MKGRESITCTTRGSVISVISSYSGDSAVELIEHGGGLHFQVPPSVAERLHRVLNEDPTSPLDSIIDLSFLEDGRTGNFVVGKDQYPAALLDLPCVVESFKTYDDNVLIKTADVGQIIMVREPEEPAPEGPEYKHGLTPPMRDARRWRFRREPDLNVSSWFMDLWVILRFKKLVVDLSIPVARVAVALLDCCFTKAGKSDWSIAGWDDASGRIWFSRWRTIL